MRFALKKKQWPEPVSIASQADCVSAVRLALPTAGKPRLLAALLRRSNEPTAEKIDLVSRELRLNRAEVQLLLEAHEYQFVQVEMPTVPAEELKNAVKWQIKDLLRFPVDQATLDVLPPATVENAAGRRPMGFAVAAPNEIVLDRMLRFRTTRSRLKVIDIPEQAQRNVADLLEESGRATAVLSINPNGCMLTASRGGNLYFTRNFDVSSTALEGDEMLRRSLFDRLVLELQRSIDVLEHQFSYFSLSALWLAPFPFRDELLSLLIETLYLPVRAIELAEIIDCGACPLPEEERDQAALFLTLGLGLRKEAPV